MPPTGPPAFQLKFGRASWGLSLPDSLAATFAPLMLHEMPKTRAAVDPVLVKLEIMVSDVVIRTEVEVAYLASVILAMRASR
jgi:hypothetical protein